MKVLNRLFLVGAALGMALAASARPPSRPATPGSQQAGAQPGAQQQAPTPNSRQTVRTPNGVQTSQTPNSFFGGVAPSQEPVAPSTFTNLGSTVTVIQASEQGVIVSSFAPGSRIFLPLEMQ